MVRRERRELPRAGVDRLEDRAHAERVADAAHLGLGDAAQLRDLGVAEAVLLRERGGSRHPARGGCATSSATSLISTIWSRNHGSMPVASNSLLDRCAPGAQRLLHRRRCGRRSGRFATSSSSSTVRGLVAPVEARSALLERAQRLLQRRRVVAADRHRLADRLHGRGEGGVGGRELLEGEARHLDDDVVERRLEARRGDLGDVVRDLVEPVADRELRGDLRDREAGRLRGERATSARRAGSSR